MAGLVWFRRDLRLGDNPAWSAATREHDEVSALFVVDPTLWEASGDHRRDQLAAHLGALDEALAARGGRLTVRRGDPSRVITQEAAAGTAVYWNDDYTPYATRRDEAIAEQLGERAHRFHGTSVHPPGTVFTQAGDPYRVFTPFSKAWRDVPLPAEVPEGKASVSDDAGDGIPAAAADPLMPAGEEAALARFREFLERIDQYPEERDRPDLDTTSRLSADLKFGTLSPARAAREAGEGSEGRAAWVRQLCWRDFYAQLLYYNPHTVDAPMRSEYATMEWRDDPDDLQAWKDGMTGYPIIDAGMRQLQAEGWMHNRVRMLTASFLTKDLLIDWRLGERHFMELLVDGDVAQNVGNWQWVAGTGADAAPYFRIFNPVTQSKKFDPDGAYIRRYVPELSAVEGSAIHAPWEAGPLELAAWGVTLGETYPAPMVDHAEARVETLAAYERARESSG